MGKPDNVNLALYRKREKDAGLFVILAISLIFALSFGAVNILKFRIFSSTCFGWAQQYSYLKLIGGKSIFSLYVIPEYAVLYYFFSPVNYLFAFIYRFFHNQEGLLILQSLAMMMCPVPIYLVARNHLRNTYLALIFSLSCLLQPVLTTGAMLGFIPPSFGLLFILCAFYYLEKENFNRFLFFIILANMSKIDAVIMTLILGLILGYSKDRAKYGRAIFRISLIWLIILVVFSLTYLNRINRTFPAPLLHFDRYGEKLIDGLRYAQVHSISVAGNILNKKNMLFDIFFGLPNIFSFLAPYYLLPVLPELGFTLLRNQHSSGHFLIIGFVFIGAIFGLEKIINFGEERFVQKEIDKPRYKSVLYILFTLLFLIVLFKYYYFKPETDFADNLGPPPFTRGFSFEFYKPTRHTDIGHKFLKLIPDEASCITSPSLAIHLGRCESLSLFTREVLKIDYNWDYIFLDLSMPEFYHIEKNEFSLQLKKFLTNGKYGSVAFEDGWLLLKKGYMQEKNGEALNYMETRFAK